jgi:tRNA modification GTPase
MPRSYLDPPTPVAALATPPGESALALIRAAGPGSIELAAACFSRGRALLAAADKTMVHGRLFDPATGERVDEVLVAVFRGPASSTGEDGVEITCHGSPAVLRRALAVLESAGFAPALPGEFSFRAFLHGRLDLVRAEAVQELVRARSEGARAEALRRLEGGLSRRVAAARRALVDLMAEIEARLDHEEAVESPDDPALGEGSAEAAIMALRDEIAALSASYAAGKLYREGARVVVAGRPNAGKSSLFNLLLREERAIVSPEPGTTRDWIEAEIEVEGMPLRLADTAGLRETATPVEAEGVARSRRLAAEADLVVYLVDGTAGFAAEDLAYLSPQAGKPPALRVWNKIDDPACAKVPEGFIRLSARSGEGFPEFGSALASALSARFGRAAEREVHVASERQKCLLDRAVAALGETAMGIASGLPLDAAAVGMREASDALGEITGEIASEEVLAAVFSRFCIGK